MKRVWEAWTTPAGGPRLAVFDRDSGGMESYSVEVFRCPGGGRPIAATPEPQPTASVRAQARRAKGALSIGRVTCPQRCTVDLTVSGGGRTLRRSLSVTGLRALTIARRHGRLTITIAVDGKVLARGVSKAR